LTFVPGISVSNNVATCNGTIEKEDKLVGKIKISVREVNYSESIKCPLIGS